MREIKFRAWIPTIAKIREVISIEFNSGDEDVYTRTPMVLVWDHESVRAAKIKGRVARLAKSNVELMQYTGLKDKNGREIYEGDVCQFSDVTDRQRFKGAVVWVPDAAMFSVDVEGQIYKLMGWLHSLEVIGNVFENPDLIKCGTESA